MLRILLPCSDQLPWDTVCSHLNDVMRKLQYSEGIHNYLDTLWHSLQWKPTYELIKQKSELGIRPVSQPKTWRWREREQKKWQKRLTWYKKGGFDSVLFVPFTPNGRLRMMHEREIASCGFRIKVMERTEQRTNPKSYSYLWKLAGLESFQTTAFWEGGLLTVQVRWHWKLH